jgi:hypothetical protein
VDGGAGPREFLAGRIVVPELRGSHCVWFIGRTLEDTPGLPKYLALGGERSSAKVSSITSRP